MSLSEKEYQRWLKAAYHYYWGDGDTGMSDAEWDYLGKQVVPEEHSELKGTNYEPGQSLFWLDRDKYPDWAKS